MVRDRGRCQHDAGVAELGLDGLEVRAGLMCKGRGTVAEVVQPDRRDFVEGAELVEAVGEVVGVQWPLVGGEDVAGVLPLLWLSLAVTISTASGTAVQPG
jgi:hypothetical protein